MKIRKDLKSEEMAIKIIAKTHLIKSYKRQDVVVSYTQ